MSKKITRRNTRPGGGECRKHAGRGAESSRTACGAVRNHTTQVRHPHDTQTTSNRHPKAQNETQDTLNIVPFSFKGIPHRSTFRLPPLHQVSSVQNLLSEPISYDFFFKSLQTVSGKCSWSFLRQFLYIRSNPFHLFHLYSKSMENAPGAPCDNFFRFAPRSETPGK